ncbi:choice-of-anchor A family protein [Sesbania bispinosa]|nr:choice-of-anchor A family protein [Sesbania bispinosa]
MRRDSKGCHGYAAAAMAAWNGDRRATLQHGRRRDGGVWPQGGAAAHRDASPRLTEGQATAAALLLHEERTVTSRWRRTAATRQRPFERGGGMAAGPQGAVAWTVREQFGQGLLRAKRLGLYDGGCGVHGGGRGACKGLRANSGMAAMDGLWWFPLSFSPGIEAKGQVVVTGAVGSQWCYGDGEERKRPGKSSGQTDKTPGTNIRRKKGKDPEQTSGQTDKTPGTNIRRKGKDLEKHQVKLINSWKTIRRKGKRPGKPSGQTDKTPGKPSGGKGKDLENHQVKLINSWKTIRKKGKRPGKPSGQTDKTPGKPSGGKGKDLENHQVKLINPWKTIRKKGKRPGKPSGQLIRLLENHQEERENTW